MSLRLFSIAAALVLLSVGSAADARQAEISSPQASVIELAPLAAPTINGWTLVSEIHEFEFLGGGHSTVNILYAAKGKEKLQLYESTRPARYLASAGPYWVFWDTKVAHMGALVFVVYVPAGGRPFVVFQSLQQESSVYLNDELMSCQLIEGKLLLKLHTTNVDTGKRYQRDFSISTEPAEPR